MYTWLDIIANVISTAVYIYPLRNMVEVHNGSRKQEDIAPYMVTLTCTVLWAIEAELEGKTTRLITSIIGATIHVVYVFVILGESRGKKLIKIETWGLKMIFMIMALMTGLKIPTMQSTGRYPIMGVIIFPFATAKAFYTIAPAVKAIKKRSCALMHRSQSALLLAQGLTWCIYGVVDGYNFFILIPNAIGCLIAVGQLVIRGVINKKAQPVKPN